MTIMAGKCLNLQSKEKAHGSVSWVLHINNLYKQLTEVAAAAEKITATQLSAMLLRRAAYMTSKDISEVADNTVQDKPLGVAKEVSVEAGALLLSSLEVGRKPYTMMRGLLKEQLGVTVIPRYEMVS